MKILIIEDEQRLARLLKQGLEEQGFVVDMAHDGSEGQFMAENYSYDAILLDLLIPEVDGLTILKTLRAQGKGVPILIITARGDVEDRIRGLNLGADDYLAKPFDLEELIARIHALIRRSRGQSSSLIKIGDLIIDTNTRTVSRSEVEIALTAREYDVLTYLALNSGKVISRNELIEHIYTTDCELDSNVIDVYINYLRNKIDKSFVSPLIHTVRGAGYILKVEV
jgi:DNA-binding response OmpR family regulator